MICRSLYQSNVEKSFKYKKFNPLVKKQRSFLFIKINMFNDAKFD